LFPVRTMNEDRVAVLLDGGFVKKRLAEKVDGFPPLDEIIGLTADLLRHPDVSGLRLFRTYWYDADPFGQKRKNPIDGTQTNFATTLEANRNRDLMSRPEVEPDFAVRKGELLYRSGHRVARAETTRQ
jgi:hypothetical protein